MRNSYNIVQKTTLIKDETMLNKLLKSKYTSNNSGKPLSYKRFNGLYRKLYFRGWKLYVIKDFPGLFNHTPRRISQFSYAEYGLFTLHKGRQQFFVRLSSNFIKIYLTKSESI